MRLVVGSRKRGRGDGWLFWGTMTQHELVKKQPGREDPFQTILGRWGCSGWGVQWMAGTGGAISRTLTQTFETQSIQDSK